MLNNLPTVEPTQPNMTFDLTVGEKVKNLNIRPWVRVSRHQGWASLDFGSDARDELGDKSRAGCRGGEPVEGFFAVLHIWEPADWKRLLRV